MIDICGKCIHGEVCKYTGTVLELMEKQKEMAKQCDAKHPLSVELKCTYFFNDIRNRNVNSIMDDKKMWFDVGTSNL